MTDEARALRRVIDSLSERLDATEARLAEATRLLEELLDYIERAAWNISEAAAFLAAVDGSEQAAAELERAGERERAAELIAQVRAEQEAERDA